MVLSLTLNGVEYISRVSFSSILVQEAVELKGSTMDFTIMIYDNLLSRPEAGNEIIFLDGSDREFAGVVVEVRATMGESNLAIFYACSCIGYEFYLDRRYLNKIYDSQSADSMVGEMLDDLQNDSNSDDQHYNDFQGDKSLLLPGPVISAQRFENTLPTEAIQVIEEASGMQFRMTFNKQIQLVYLGTNEAPLPTPSGRTQATLDVDNDITNYHDLTITESIISSGSKAIIPSTGIKSSDTTTDDFVWRTGDDRIFELTRRPFSHLDIISVKVNGGSALNHVLEDVAVDRNTDPGTGNVAIYVGETAAGNQSYVRLSSSDVSSNGDTIEVVYNYVIEDDHEGIQLDIIDELADRTDGDGVHEFVWSRARGLQVQNIEDLDTITKLLLSHKGKVHRNGEFLSFTKGWEAGQVFDLLWNSVDIDEEMFIIQIRKTVRTPAGNTNDPSAGDPWLETQVMFSNIPRGLVR